MDKHLFDTGTINDLLLAIMTGQREQVESYMRQLQRYHAEIKHMSDQELMPLLPLLSTTEQTSITEPSSKLLHWKQLRGSPVPFRIMRQIC